MFGGRDPERAWTEIGIGKIVESNADVKDGDIAAYFEENGEEIAEYLQERKPADLVDAWIGKRTAEAEAEILPA